MATRINGLISGLDTESLVKSMVSSYSNKVTKYTKAQTKLSWTQEAWKGINKKVYSLYTNASKLRFSGAYNMQKTKVSDGTKATASANGSAVAGTQKLNVLSLAQTAYVTGGKISAASADAKLSALSGFQTETVETSVTGADGAVTTETKEVPTKIEVTVNGTKSAIDLTGDTKISDVVSALRDKGLNASYDEKNGRFYISARKSGKANDFSISVVAGDVNSAAAIKALGLEMSAGGGADTTQYATKIEASDAQIRLNGVLYTGDSNNFLINGLGINASGITGDGDDKAITVTTETDGQGIYDKVKDFLTEYNNVINEITKLYNAESASGYEPLTDEEKDAMSESEVEKWESKIKNSLLRRDTTLGGVMQSMLGAMSGTYEINGEKMSLSNFGIHTLGFLNAAENEQNAFHIDGDEDDENSSGKPDKLMAAINSNPEQVMEFMKKLSSELYNTIGGKMASTTYSSAYTLYNDKQMNSQAAQYKLLISQWEDKLADKEDFYYKKFSAMESKLSQLQSQTTNLASLFGTK